jgi:iron-sulfur cluster repair protein YtfE (RIC family)
VPLTEHEQPTSWQAAPLTDLIHHLVGTRHQECRDDMSELETFLALNAMEPGPAHLDLVEIRDLMAHFCTELRAHLAREERDLFPVLLAMEQGMTPGIGKQHLGLMKSLLEEEHGHEAKLLQDIRIFTATLATGQPAESALARLQDLLAGLSARFEAHIQLESQALFPRMGQTDAVAK